MLNLCGIVAAVSFNCFILCLIFVTGRHIWKLGSSRISFLVLMSTKAENADLHEYVVGNGIIECNAAFASLGQVTDCFVQKLQQRHGLEHGVNSRIYLQLYEFFRQHFRIFHFCYKRQLHPMGKILVHQDTGELLFSSWFRWSATFVIKYSDGVAPCAPSYTREKFAMLPLRICTFHNDSFF